jgi:TonB-linked SusC/RagA family outer membrane protein
MNFSVQHAERQSVHRLDKSLPARLALKPVILQLMRISVVLSAILFTSLQVLLATTPGRGQTTRITLELRGESLQSAIKKIETLTPFRFVYRNEEVRSVGNLTLPKAERTIAETLGLILDNTDLTYRQIKKNILIVKKEETFSDRIESSVEHTVAGRVTDPEGQPLAGVSIVLKGTTSGTTTNEDGRYTLSLENPAGTLLFSFIGFSTEEVSIDNRTTIDIQLTPDIRSLNEIVVTALGITREEKSLGYATQEVKGSNLTLTKEQNVLGSLAGKVAGVQVSGSPGGSMGGTQKIKIRGVNLLDGSGEPLIVLDGTPMLNSNFAGRNGQDYGNIIQDLNPDDIESVNILKGPAASALYGSRGQHGVIMITTKKGNVGAQKVSIDYSGAFSMEQAGNFMPNQNLYGGGSTQVFGTLADGTPFANNNVDESWGPKMDGTPVRQFYSWFPLDPDYGKTTPYLPHPDNIKDYYEVGHTVNNSIAISGGGNTSTFRISYNRTSIEGIEPNTWLKRNNLSFSGSLNATEKLKVSTSLNYANNSAQRPPQGYDYGSTYFNQWFQRSVDMKRLKNYKYADGSFLHWNIGNPNGAGVINTDALYWNNPYFDAYENFSEDGRDRYFGNVGLSYNILPDLKVSGFIRSDMYTQNINNRSARGGRYTDGYSVGKYQGNETNYEFLGQYAKEWGKLSLSANLGGNIRKEKFTRMDQTTQGGLSIPGFYNTAASIDRPVVSSSLSRKEVRSLYGMVSLGYNDTWFLDATLRNDNSSALPENNNSFWYPSVSGSAVFSELFQWQPLSLGKLRMSYAIAGSDLDPYRTSTTYGIGSVYANDNGTTSSLFIPDVLNNPAVEPSFSHAFETGLDLKFFNNRLGLSFTWYQQRNINQILQLPVSGASGYTSTVINAGLIENKGFEISLTGTPVQTDKFRWDANFNVSRNTSMVKKLYNDGVTEINNHQISSNTYSGRTVSVNAKVGEAYGNLIGQAYLRDAATGKIMLGANNLPLYEVNHNFGSVLPDYTGGFQNTFSYGPFSLNAMIDFQMGGQFFSWSRMLSVKSGQAVETAALNENGKNVRDPVAEGGGVKIEGISSVTGQDVSTFVDAKPYFRSTLGTHIYEEWLYDASYIRLREVRLGYSFKKFGRLPINSLTVSLIARNPAMLWQKAPEGLNPAELANGSEPISWLETGQLITVRSYGLSLTASF